MNLFTCIQYKQSGQQKIIFQHAETPEAHKTQPTEPPAIASLGQNPEQLAGNQAAAAGLRTCNAMQCMVEIKEEPWQKKANQILEKIQQDPGLVIAFNTFLREYGKTQGVSEEDMGVLMGPDVKDNFYAILGGTSVPNSEIGFNTTWNDILFVAEKSCKDAGEKGQWPYERLKTIIDSVRNESGALAQR